MTSALVNEGPLAQELLVQGTSVSYLAACKTDCYLSWMSSGPLHPGRNSSCGLRPPRPIWAAILDRHEDQTLQTQTAHLICGSTSSSLTSNSVSFSTYSSFTCSSCAAQTLVAGTYLPCLTSIIRIPQAERCKHGASNFDMAYYDRAMLVTADPDPQADEMCSDLPCA